MSNGYTRAFARTAPLAPATASPHGGITSLDWTPIARSTGSVNFVDGCDGQKRSRASVGMYRSTTGSFTRWFFLLSLESQCWSSDLKAQVCRRGRRYRLHGELGVITCLMSPAKSLFLPRSFGYSFTSKQGCCRQRCQLTRVALVGTTSIFFQQRTGGPFEIEVTCLESSLSPDVLSGIE
jgi:hypothetical protein